MKKVFFVLMAAIVLFLASCAQSNHCPAYSLDDEKMKQEQNS